MRALFTCAGEYGHLHSLLPLARSLVATGHEAIFGLPDSFRSRAEEAGFDTIAVGLDRAAIGRELEDRFPEWRFVSMADRLRFAMVTTGARVAAPPMVDDLVAAIEHWRADLIVHGPVVLAGPIAAAAAGIPSVNHGWGPLLPLDTLRLAAEACAALWEQRGLTPEPLGGMFGNLYFDVCPPSLQTPQIDQIATAHPLRPLPADGVGAESLPDWVGALASQPTVYVTLGTFCNRFTNLFSTILAGLRDLPVNVVVTVGYDQDPRTLGPQPQNVYIERYIPTSQLVPRCQLVVCHGGSATVLAALSHGVPLLLLPQGHDQLQNGERCVAIGVAQCLEAGTYESAAVRDAATALLDREEYSCAARKMQKEIESMPGPDAAVWLLEALVAHRRPLVG